MALRELNSLRRFWPHKIHARNVAGRAGSPPKSPILFFQVANLLFLEDIHWIANGPRLQLAALGGNQAQRSHPPSDQGHGCALSRERGGDALTDPLLVLLTTTVRLRNRP